MRYASIKWPSSPRIVRLSGAVAVLLINMEAGGSSAALSLRLADFVGGGAGPHKHGLSSQATALITPDYRHSARPAHQMALITSGCAPSRPRRDCPRHLGGQGHGHPPPGGPWPAAAPPMENPYCSCNLTRALLKDVLRLPAVGSH